MMWDKVSIDIEHWTFLSPGIRLHLHRVHDSDLIRPWIEHIVLYNEQYVKSNRLQCEDKLRYVSSDDFPSSFAYRIDKLLQQRKDTTREV